MSEGIEQPLAQMVWLALVQVQMWGLELVALGVWIVENA